MIQRDLRGGPANPGLGVKHCYQRMCLKVPGSEVDKLKGLNQVCLASHKGHSVHGKNKYQIWPQKCQGFKSSFSHFIRTSKFPDTYK